MGQERQERAAEMRKKRGLLFARLLSRARVGSGEAALNVLPILSPPCQQCAAGALRGERSKHKTRARNSARLSPSGPATP